MISFLLAYLLLCTFEVLGVSFQPCSAPLLPSGRPGVSNDTSIAPYKDEFCRKPAVLAKPADHLLPSDTNGTYKSTTEVAGTTAASSLSQAPTHPRESPSSTNSISVQQSHSLPPEGIPTAGGSLLNTEQKPGAPTVVDAAGVVALAADSLKTPMRKAYAGSDSSAESGKPVATGIHTISVFLDRPTQATNVPAPIKQPFKPDSAYLVLPTEFPGQSDIQGQTLTPGEAVTRSGTLISLASDGSQLIVGTSTQAVGLAPSVARQDGMLPVLEPLQAITADALTPQPTNNPTLEPGLSLTKAGTLTPVTTSKTLVLPADFHGQPEIQGQTLTPGEALTQSGTLISLASDGSRLIVGTSTLRVSEGQSKVVEGQQQSFEDSHRLETSGSVFVSGTLVSLGSGLSSIVMGTQVQATGSHGTGSPSRGLSNSTSPVAFQGYATRPHVIWGGLVTVAFSALISMFFV